MKYTEMAHSTDALYIIRLQNLSGNRDKMHLRWTCQEQFLIRGRSCRAERRIRERCNKFDTPFRDKPRNPDRDRALNAGTKVYWRHERRNG